MLEGQSSKSLLDQSADVLRRANFHETRYAGNDVRFGKVRPHAEDPLRRVKTAMVLHGSSVEKWPYRLQFYVDAVRWCNNLQLGADVFVERVETVVQMVVIVCRKIAGMRVERKRAEGAGKSRNVDKQLLGMRAFRLEMMTQWRQTSMDRVRQPEVRDLSGGKVLERLFCRLAFRGHRIALGVQNLNQPMEHLHQPCTGADLEAGRDVFGIVDKVPSSVSMHTSQRERHGVVVWLRVENQAKVLAPHRDGLFVLARRFIEDEAVLGHVPNLPVLTVRCSGTVGLTPPVRRNGQ